MELKRKFAFSITQTLNGFNRTFMELKLGSGYLDWVQATSFNRTFMELKLLLPTMNWTRQYGFNRTFMELKLYNLPIIIIS